MNKLKLIAIGVVAASLFFTSCKKVEGCSDSAALNYDDEVKEKNDDGSCQYKGKVTFWTDADTGCEAITIKMGGSTVGTLSNYSTDGKAPECGTTGYVTLELEPGNYSYDAEDVCGTWSGSVVIESEGCLTQLLDQ